MAARANVMTCHYEILGVSRDAPLDAIKRAYRTMALRWHPDKNVDNQEEATNMFKQVQSAWEVLSNEQERSWYDSHREQILRGGRGGRGGGGGGGNDDDESGGGGVDEDEVDIAPLFNPSCYDGFTDAPTAFFAVYAEAFEAIVQNERKEVARGGVDADSAAAERIADAPCFGDSQAAWTQVKTFYAYWTNFVSARSFSWCDKWNLTEGPNRQYRRAMEKENKKERDTARKEYVNDVRELVEFVKRRDPRWAAGQLRMKQEAAVKAEEAAAAKQRADEARAEQRRAWQAELAQREAEMAAARAEAYGDDASSVERSDRECDVFECVVCDKSFKSAKQLQNHEQSKKHRDALAALRRQLDAEEREMWRLAGDGDEQNDEAATKGGTNAGGDLDVDLGEERNTNMCSSSNSSSNRKQDKRKKKSAKRRELEEDDSDRDYVDVNVQPPLSPTHGDDAIVAATADADADQTKSTTKKKRNKKKSKAVADDEFEDEQHERDDVAVAAAAAAAAASQELDASDDGGADKRRKKKEKKKGRRALAIESDDAESDDRECAALPAASLAASMQRVSLADSSGDDTRKEQKTKKDKTREKKDKRVSTSSSAFEAVGHDGDQIFCKACKTVFASKTKLFEHLKQNPKHAAAKDKV